MNQIAISRIENFEHLRFLNEQQLQNLTNCMQLKKVSKGDIIYKEGEPKDYVYLIVEGSVKLASHTGEGKMLIKDILHDQSIFGENIFAGNECRYEFAEAIADTEYYQISSTDFKRLAEQNSDFASYILDVIVNRLFDLEERLKNFVFKSAKERIMFFIRKTGEKRGIKIGIDECLINHGMSHKEIASLTDTSRQTVARVLSELKRTNVIHFSPRKPNKILIRDMSSL